MKWIYIIGCILIAIIFYVLGNIVGTGCNISII